MKVTTDTSKLVDGTGLLENMFEKSCRPTARWLLEQRKTGRIPFTRCGRLIFYDPVRVRAALFSGDSSGDSDDRERSLCVQTLPLKGGTS
jgi:hypothetical protein